MNKPAFNRICPDCMATYDIDENYSDEAYQAHADNDPNAVCQACFDKFCGLTIDQIFGVVPERRGQ